jgi:hypothetical protein
VSRVDWKEAYLEAKPRAKRREQLVRSSNTTQDTVIPALQVRHSEGEGWSVAARWPDGHIEHIAIFKSEFEANEWIANDFQTWLETRKNGDQAKLS